MHINNIQPRQWAFGRLALLSPQPTVPLAALSPETQTAPFDITDAFQNVDHIRFPTRVVAKGADWLQLERPLPYDLRTRWRARP